MFWQCFFFSHLFWKGQGWVIYSIFPPRLLLLTKPRKRLLSLLIFYRSTKVCIHHRETEKQTSACVWCCALITALTPPHVLDERKWACNLHDSHYDWELGAEAAALPASKGLEHMVMLLPLVSWPLCSSARKLHPLTRPSRVGFVPAHPIGLRGCCFSHWEWNWCWHGLSKSSGPLVLMCRSLAMTSSITPAFMCWVSECVLSDVCSLWRKACQGWLETDEYGCR